MARAEISAADSASGVRRSSINAAIESVKTASWRSNVRCQPSPPSSSSKSGRPRLCHQSEKMVASVSDVSIVPSHARNAPAISARAARSAPSAARPFHRRASSDAISIWNRSMSPAVNVPGRESRAVARSMR